MDRPIIFSTPMVRALLDGRKTQTRRIVKPQPWSERGMWFWHKSPYRAGNTTDILLAEWLQNKCPYGVAGDRLWVRETLWQHNNFGFPLGKSPQLQSGIGERVWSYTADNLDRDHKTGTISSIHMPRWASRITLEITNVRVERLQDITAKDCEAEGAFVDTGVGLADEEINLLARDQFQQLWDSIYAKPRPVMDDDGKVSHYVSFPWDGTTATRKYRGNPWIITPNPRVWVLEFTRHLTGNVTESDNAPRASSKESSPPPVGAVEIQEKEEKSL